MKDEIDIEYAQFCREFEPEQQVFLPDAEPIPIRLRYNLPLMSIGLAILGFCAVGAFLYVAFMEWR